MRSLEEYLIIILGVLINVAFITLMERKCLAISQARVGPNKVGALGLLQPAADAVKLFTNRLTVLGPINKLVFFASPAVALLLTVLFRAFVNFAGGEIRARFSVFLLLMLLRLNVYPLLGTGWGSNRKYASLGALRAAAQTVSYEIRLAFVIISLLAFRGSAAFAGYEKNAGLPLLIGPLLALFIPWVVTCVAELNRTPFDFAEGESELVSGFNVEYGSVKFAIIFMAEYGIIYILSLLTAFIFFSPTASYHRVGGLVGVGLRFMCIWLRATLPRFRYDLLIELTWKSLLPSALGIRQSALMIHLILYRV